MRFSTVFTPLTEIAARSRSSRAVAWGARPRRTTREPSTATLGWGRSHVDEVVGRLTEPDQLHRDAEIGLDREHDPSLGRAVELREHDPGHLDGVGELACLREPVLACRGVEHEEHLGDLARLAVGDAAHL